MSTRDLFAPVVPYPFAVIDQPLVWRAGSVSSEYVVDVTVSVKELKHETVCVSVPAVLRDRILKHRFDLIPFVAMAVRGDTAAHDRAVVSKALAALSDVAGLKAAGTHLAELAGAEATIDAIGRGIEHSELADVLRSYLPKYTIMTRDAIISDWFGAGVAGVVAIFDQVHVDRFECIRDAEDYGSGSEYRATVTRGARSEDLTLFGGVIPLERPAAVSVLAKNVARGGDTLLFSSDVNVLIRKVGEELCLTAQ
jgi:hypothetical protein